MLYTLCYDKSAACELQSYIDHVKFQPNDKQQKARLELYTLIAAAAEQKQKGHTHRNGPRPHVTLIMSTALRVSTSTISSIVPPKK